MGPHLIGIAGPSCSGKSTLARQLASEVLKGTVVSLDDYWDPSYDVPTIGKWKNRELPGNINFDHLYRDLSELKAGRSVVAPKWLAAEKRFEQQTIEPVPTIIAEGYLLYYDERIRNLFDLRTYLDVGDEEIIGRRIARNRTGRPERHEYYRTVVVEEYKKYGLPAKQYATIILDGSRPIEENSFRIRNYCSWVF